MVKAIADLVAAVAWPGVVLLLAYMFREPVAKFINDAKLLKFGAMSAERQVREEVDRSGKEAEAAEGRSDGPTSNELVRAGVVERLAENSDAAVIRGQARELGEEYERVRGSLPSGDDRTRAMEVVVSKMRTIGRAVIPVRYDLSASNSPGERLAAIASLQVALDYDFIPWLTDRAETERPFISYHAMVAILGGLRDPAAPRHAEELASSVLRLRTLGRESRGFQRDPSRVHLLRAIEGAAGTVREISDRLAAG